MDTAMHKDEIEVDLGEIISLFLHRVWLIISIGVLSALVGYLCSSFVITPTYESTTKIYILNKQDKSTVTYSDVQLGTQLTKDYAELVQSRFVLEEVIQELNLQVDYEKLKNHLSITTPSDTRILAITVEDTNPVMAMDMTNAIREVASVHIANVMDIEAVNIVETANLPIEKSTPNVAKWTAALGFLGLLIVCIIIIAVYLLDDTVKSADDIEKYLHLSTLALIPVIDSQGQQAKNKRKRKKKFIRGTMCRK